MKYESPQQRILNALQKGVCGWDDLREVVNLSDDQLGLTLADLFNHQLICTGQRDDVRVYGIELRAGLMPRFINSRPPLSQLQ